MSAVDDLRFLERRFRGVLELIPQLEKFPSLENYITELEKKKAALILEVAGAEASLVSMADQKKDTDTKVSKILEKANADAEGILLSAKEKAEAILDKATKDVEKKWSEADAGVKIVFAEKEAIEKTIATLTRVTSEKQNLYDTLLVKLADLKSKL